MKTRTHRPPLHRQAGQAIIWFLATVAACCCVFALVYNVGQVSNRKEETVNAADASAMSGALVQARMLNFMAYANRATVANEVTIAQFVSLDSWVQYDYELLQWLANYTAIIPGVGAVTSAIANAAQIGSTVVDQVARVAIPINEFANKGLKLARDGAAKAGETAPTDIADKIATANSAQLTARSLAKPHNVDAWKAFTRNYDGDERSELRQVVLDSRDPFTAHRKLGSFFETANVALNFILKEVHKTSGETTLQGFDSWAGQDSMDIETLTPSICGLPFNPHPCLESSPTPVPVGYGRADANSNSSTGDNLCNEHIGFLGINLTPTVNCVLAENNGKHLSYGGLSSIRDLERNLPKGAPCAANNGSTGPSLSFVAAVRRVADANLTAERMGVQNRDVQGPQGSPHLRDDLPGGGKLNDITSVSTACVFFRRPPRDSTAHDIARFDVAEAASLYNPYWQVRLTSADPTFTTRVYASIGKAGLNVITQ